MPFSFPIDTYLKNGLAVQLAPPGSQDVKALRGLFEVIVQEGDFLSA
jgi:hypothetical protein